MNEKPDHNSVATTATTKDAKHIQRQRAMLLLYKKHLIAQPELPHSSVSLGRKWLPAGCSAEQR